MSVCECASSNKGFNKLVLKSQDIITEDSFVLHATSCSHLVW